MKPPPSRSGAAHPRKQVRPQAHSRAARGGASPASLSVVVASTRRPEDLDGCLRALTHQKPFAGRAEILVADGSGSATTTLRARYPHAAYLSFAPETPLPVLWGAGIQQSTGPVIAITDSTTRVRDDWMAAVLGAHASSPHPIIGGAVDPLPKNSPVDWTAYFCDYAAFMRPLPGGEVGELPGNNVTFKRALLRRGNPAYVTPAFWKSYWCRSLQDEGVALWSDPSLVVYDAKSYGLAAFLRRRFCHGRCFGGMRRVRMSGAQRAAYAAGTPLLPFLFLLRAARAALPKRRYRREFFATLPFSFLATASWSLGELCGYARGAGPCCRRIY